MIDNSINNDIIKNINEIENTIIYIFAFTSLIIYFISILIVIYLKKIIFIKSKSFTFILVNSIIGLIEIYINKKELLLINNIIIYIY